jgi:hypothetical protein
MMTPISLRAPARSAAALIVLLFLSACSIAPYRPEPFAEQALLERASTQRTDGIEISAYAPSADETAKWFGAPLFKRAIQPVWLKVQNDSHLPLRLTHYSIDPAYFPPLEVAYIHRKRFSKQGWLDMEAYLYGLSLPRRIEGGTTASGFVFTNLSEGTKAFNVDLFYVDDALEEHRFTFFLQVPGFRPDHADIDFFSLYEEKEVQDTDLNGLHRVLEALPCCSTDRTGGGAGKPINIVLIGKGSTLLQSLLRAEWSETSYQKNETYLAAADYLFERPPDAIFRKRRGKTTDRSELNLWLAPILWEGQPIWLAQFKHAIGRRFEIEEVFLGTRMDPDVDDGRSYLLQNLWYAQALKAFARSQTGKLVPKGAPVLNFRNNPYFTDGYRFIMWLSDKPVALDDIQLINLDESPVEAKEP